MAAIGPQADMRFCGGSGQARRLKELGQLLLASLRDDEEIDARLAFCNRRAAAFVDFLIAAWGMRTRVTLRVSHCGANPGIHKGLAHGVRALSR